jgi:hypothetical protein
LPRLPWLALVPILALAIWVTVSTPYRASPPIRSDGLGYYAWTEAILQGNFDFCQWSGEPNFVRAISARNATHPARCENKYPPGLALLRLPLMAPFAAIAEHGDASRLTVGQTEETESQWLGVAALLATLLLLNATMRRLGVRGLTVDATLLAVCFGTGLFHYATFDGSYTEIYSAALFAALLLLGVDAAHRGRSPNRWLLFGLALFIALIREPDIPALLMLVAAWIAWRLRSLAREKRRRAVAEAIVPVLAALVLVGAFQLLYNHWSTGSWTLSSYGQEAFLPGQLKEGAVLFSYNHGLFVWYPVLAVLLVAALWQRRSRAWGLVALGTVALLTVIYGSWHSWWLGESFGLRGFVDIVPVIAVAGAVGLSSLSTRARRWTLCAAALCTLVTLQLMLGYWSGTLPYAHSTGKQYWHQIIGS